MKNSIRDMVDSNKKRTGAQWALLLNDVFVNVDGWASFQNFKSEKVSRQVYDRRKDQCVRYQGKSYIAESKSR